MGCAPWLGPGVVRPLVFCRLVWHWLWGFCAPWLGFVFGSCLGRWLPPFVHLGLALSLDPLLSRPGPAVRLKACLGLGSVLWLGPVVATPLAFPLCFLYRWVPVFVRLGLALAVALSFLGSGQLLARKLPGSGCDSVLVPVVAWLLACFGAFCSALVCRFSLPCITSCKEYVVNS